MVEDSEDDSFLLHRLLNKAGWEYESQVVDNLDTLRQRLEEGGWDILLSDYNLPGFNALDVLALVAECVDYDLPVIVLSGAMGEEVAVDVMRAGAQDYVIKDNMPRLLPAIERELAEREVRRQRALAENARRESEARFGQLAQNIDEVFWLFDCDEQRMLYVSPAYEALWEQSAGQLDGQEGLLATIYPDDYALVEAMLQEKGWLGLEGDYRIQRPDGSVRWVNTRSFPIYSPTGELQRVAGVSSDVTERKEHEAETKKLVRALEQTADMVMITDRDGMIEYVNQAYEDVSGYRREEMIGRRPTFLKSGLHDKRFYKRIWQSLLNGIPFTEIFINRRKSGELYFESKTITPVRDERGDVSHFVATAKDITERLRRRDDMERAIHYDAVTGLPGRALFVDRLDKAMLKAKQDNTLLGVMFIDVGCDKAIVDEQMESLREPMTVEVAGRLKSVLTQESTLARLDDHRYALVLGGVTDTTPIEAAALAIVEAFSRPISAEGYELYLRPNMGISTYPGDGDMLDNLLRASATALQQAMDDNRNQYIFFNSDKKSASQEATSRLC